MASSSSKDIERGEEDGGENRNMTSLDAVDGSESARGVANTGADQEPQEPRVTETLLTAPSSPSWDYHSPRIQRMIETRDEFCTPAEFEIEASRVHHSEVDPAESQAEHSRKTNREYLDVLRRRRYVREGHQLVAKQLECPDWKMPWSLFIQIWSDGLEVGNKLAEGGQAEIFEASLGNFAPLVVKVFKAGSVLQELEKQWPPALLERLQRDRDDTGAWLPSVLGATLLRDERLLDRFAFVMERCWGDLRKLIDKRKIESHNKDPPFPPHVVLNLMERIAVDMRDLHGLDPPILHNDLKAANVLVRDTPSPNDGGCVVCVADYECSVGVMGTGFWRAPEILQQLKDRVPMRKLVFRKECDVYSYGMTCYEIATGRIPFEDYPPSRFAEVRDFILNGARPELPRDLDPAVANLIRRCWHPNPSERPGFDDICDQFHCRFV